MENHLNALFYFTAYHHQANERWRFAVTVPDGPHERYAQAKDLLRKEYPELSRWSGEFICLTPEEVFKEL